jgi:hypothetical protein
VCTAGDASTSPRPRTSRHGYDLVCLFDALHDMGDPVGAARRIRQAWHRRHAAAGRAERRRRAGAEPQPRRTTYYGLSTVICTPGSLAQEVGPRPRRAGRSNGQLAAAARGRVQPRAPGNRNPVQHHPGGQTVGAAEPDPCRRVLHAVASPTSRTSGESRVLTQQSPKPSFATTCRHFLEQQPGARDSG